MSTRWPISGRWLPWPGSGSASADSTSIPRQRVPKRPRSSRIELQPIDAQTNGPQLLYGLRYHTRIVEPDKPETFHDQVGYWLWEPATGALLLTLSIPRGQVAMLAGHAARDAKSFRLQAIRGSLTNGIVSGPFLEYAFRTESCTIAVTINADGTWSYEQDTVLMVRGQSEPFHHTDRNTLRKIGEATPNPVAVVAAKARQSVA